jgi:Glycosyltransferase like family
MFAFGCSIIMPDVYERCARPGIERACESDSVVLAHAASGSVARSLNLMLDRARSLDGLEALVLLHQDAEIRDSDFCSRVRRVLADPDVAIVGCVGSRGVSDIAWWDGEVSWNSAPYRHGEAGGGELAWHQGGEQAPGEVDAIYGVLMVLSPWAVANLRFDESIGLLHGYDFDISRQATSAGKKVVTANLHLAHHHSLDLVSQIEIWVSAHMRAADAWSEDAPDDTAPDEAWKARARQAEASAAAARLLAASMLLQADATAQSFARELEFVRNTRSWRMTESLRRGNSLIRAARARVKRS